MPPQGASLSRTCTTRESLMFHSCTLLAALILLVFSPAAFAQDHGDLATYTDVGAAEGALPIELCAPILDSDTCIQWVSADVLAFLTGGTEWVRINAAGQLLASDGAVSLPSIASKTVPTTGLFFNSNNISIVSRLGTPWTINANSGTTAANVFSNAHPSHNDRIIDVNLTTADQIGIRIALASGQTGDFMQFVDNGLVQLSVIDENAQFGIGDDDPDAMLDLVSNGSAVVPLRIEHAATPSVDYMQVVDSGGTALWVTDSTGDIDITDGQRLRYDGAIVIQGDATDNNWFFGEAGNLTMTGGTNFGIGVGALDSVTTGSGNVAIGVNSLTACATCVGNTAIGNTSLFRLNAAAPFANSNTAIGTSALQDATTSRGSIAIGALALLRATTGEFNVGIGNAAGTNNLTGTLNVFIGNSSGVGAVGTSHSRNSCFGAEACSGLAASGNNNIGIGYQGGDNITTGDNNLILGYQVDAQSATASNQMSIGNLLFSEGIDGTGTTLSSGFLGIATPTPAGILSLGNATEGGTWAFNKITTREVHTLAAANTSDTTTITIPSGASLRGCSFNVDTAVTTSSATNTWSAAFITGSTAALATAVAGALNTKANQLIVPEIASAATEIRFTAPGAETFTAGVIEALCIYESLTSMADA